ncbi:MAG: hypothetical protein JRD03_03560 [Deltaproteobacteria bacterium]|nr:hypothetical protein [Deltaproteobacteria bacterium]
MEKLIKEHRALYGDFEVIDYVDEGVVEKLRDELDAEVTTRLFLESPHFAPNNSLVYMHTVIPNLRSLGLITDRTEDHWRKVGMLYDTGASAAV